MLLSDALKTAKDGDTIALPSGPVAGTTFSGIKKQLRITSEDPKSPAVFNSLKMSNCAGLTFDNLEWSALSVLPGGNYSFAISGSQDIAMDSLNVHGPAGFAAYRDMSLLWLRGCLRTKVLGSEFANANFALQHHGCDTLEIRGGYFHDLRTDGVRGACDRGVPAKHITIAENFFTDFYPIAGDHPDAIQMWTTNATVPAEDINILANLIVRGAGAPMQGVFMANENGASGLTTYQGVTIGGNLVSGGMGNGIMLVLADNAAILANIVEAWPDQVSWLRWEALKNGLTMTGNEATGWQHNAKPALAPAGNADRPVATDKGKAAAQAFLDARPGWAGQKWAKQIEAACGAVVKLPAPPPPPPDPVPTPVPVPVPVPPPAPAPFDPLPELIDARDALSAVITKLGG